MTLITQLTEWSKEGYPQIRPAEKGSIELLTILQSNEKDWFLLYLADRLEKSERQLARVKAKAETLKALMGATI